MVEALKPWFDPIARKRAIPVDIRHQEGYVAVQDGRVVGFITMCVTEGCLHINWLAVHPEFHGQGIGRRLLDCAERAAVRKGIDEVTVYTLGAGSGRKAYESTRAFYFKNGFRPYRTSQTDSPRCPEEIEISKRVGKCVL